MNGNYIKIDRKMLSWEWYHDINTKVVFFHCLLKANWKDVRFEGKEIKRGSFVTSLPKLSAECNLSVKQVRVALEHLKMTNEVKIKTTSKYRIITINNYDLYQTSDKQSGKQEGSQRAVKKQANNRLVADEWQTRGQSEGSQRAVKGQSEGSQRAVKGQSKGNNRRIKEIKEINNNNISTPYSFTKDINNISNNDNINNINDIDNININNNINNNIINNNTSSKNIKLCVDKWNELKNYGIKPISRLNSGTQRYTMLQARLNEYSVDDVLKAIDNIKTSEFLQGKTSNWIITFDWFVRPNNFIKVLDGNYNNSRSQPRNKTAEMLDDFYQFTSDWAEKMEREEQLKNDS